ncbi:MAG TPA: dTDP-4-dehydrorhamnose reductase [Acidimicrobiia bacterium]|nr:dTDP-4-dehydrorhamnose reductase [Acidimicrobiia bacterium]
MRVVVTGSNGQVGLEVAERAGGGIGSADVTSTDAMREHITSAAPDVVVHCAAYTDVDGCELDPDRAMHVNADGVRTVVEAADACGAFVVAVSTDYVFDGSKPSPYVESDQTHPLSEYGRSKLAGEQAVDLDRHAVVRTSWVCGRVGRNMVKTILRLMREDVPMRFVDDQRGHPTIAADLAVGLLKIAEGRRAGLWHVTNQGAVSWYEFAREVVKAGGGDPSRVEPITTAELQPPRPAPRPANSVLASERLTPGELLPDFRESLPGLVRALS